MQSFRHENKRNSTELSKAVWKCKDKGGDPQLQWEVTAQSYPYEPGAKECNLCNDEKLAILMADPSTSLNKRSELISKCRHKNKFKLKNLK